MGSRGSAAVIVNKNMLSSGRGRDPAGRSGGRRDQDFVGHGVPGWRKHMLDTLGQSADGNVRRES